MGNPRGRPTKYTEEMPQKLIDFFDRPSRIQKEVSKVSNGQVINYFEEGPNTLPTVWAFCADIGIHDDTFYEWVKRHKDFSDAYKKAKVFQKKILMDNGLLGGYSTTFSIFVSKAVCKIREDQQETEESELVFEE
jgi:hypothetical protein